MKSIRTYLLLTLLSIITLVTFLSVLHGYRSSIVKAQLLFDERLYGMAEVIASANQDTAPRQARIFNQSLTAFFQIWSEDLMLLAHSNNAPNQLLSEIDRDMGYKDINHNGYRWRTFTLKDKHLNRWIVTGERADIRYSLAENVVTASIIPIVLAIPVMGFIIWFTIGLGLKPLLGLTSQLNNKQAGDLSSILMENIPEELEQMVITTNALLDRLNAAFIREQQFSADAAHELRTPISALKVQIHNIQRSNVNKQELQPLADSIERMGHVIGQILSLYRHSSDQATLSHSEVDIVSVAQDVIASTYEQFSIKHQKICLTGDESVVIIGSQFALETLLQNLLSNANKYTPEKGEISVNITQSDSNIRLIVEDSGLGIAESESERVFERFYRVNGDQHDSGTIGCGLGLAIVRHIASLHNAQVSIEFSPQLGGTKIIINFPRS